MVDLIKTSVGIGTKGAAAHVITTLTHQCPLELQQYTGKILSAFFAGLSDRNPAVRKTYASAIGQVIKVKFFEYLLSPPNYHYIPFDISKK